MPVKNGHATNFVYLYLSCVVAKNSAQSLLRDVGVVKILSAPGPDGIIAWMLTNFAQDTAPSIGSIFNLLRKIVDNETT